MGSPIWLLVMALTISSLSAFCSRSLSLDRDNAQLYFPDEICDS